MDAFVPTAFDYRDLDGGDRDLARAAAERIRLRMRRTAQDIIEIGRDLIAVKEALGHGKFGVWLQAEFEMTERTAQRFMEVAQQYGFKSDIVSDLTANVLYALAAPSTPDDIRDEVERRTAAGEVVTLAEIKRLKEEWASERSELKQQLSAAKETTRDAKATRVDFGQQVSALQREINALLIERNVLRHELDRLTGAPASLPLSAIDTTESQIEMLLADWHRVSPQAREEFLRKVQTAEGLAA